MIALILLIPMQASTKVDVIVFDSSKVTTKPEKGEEETNSNKVVMRVPQTEKDINWTNKLYDKFRIIQPNDQGYVLYELVRGYGDNKTAPGDPQYAEGFELLRLAGAYYLQDAYI